MKPVKSLRWRISGFAGMLALALGGMLALNARAQAPLGDTTWDCLVSGGGQKGIAILTFSSQPNGTTTSFTLSGYELIASVLSNPNGGGDGRNPAGGVGRNIDTNAPSAQTNIFGFTDVQGSWSFDASGNVIGYLWFLVQDPSNPGSVTTNAVSFKGKVVPGKRLTLTSSTSYGKVVYRGIPYGALTDLTGSTWYGVNNQNQQYYQEFFSLSPGPMGNIYQVNGYGPGYTYSTGSYCIVSGQHKIGFSFIQTTDSTNGVLRATMGNLVSNKKKTYSNTKGTAEPGVNSKFKATLQFLPPPE